MTLAELAADDVLVLLGHLLLDVELESSEYEGPEDLVQAPDQLLVVLLVALDHALERVGEPVVELAMRGEHVRHEEVHERPQLHQVVLQRRAGEQQATLRLKVEQRLPTLRAEVLDVLRLVEYEVLPLLASKRCVVLQSIIQ